MTGRVLTRRLTFGAMLATCGTALAPAWAEDRPVFEAVLHEGNRERAVARVAVDRLGRLELLSSEADRAAWMRRVATEVNATEVMHEDAPPRPGAPAFTDDSRVVKRGDPAFVHALLEHLRRYYGLELRPV